MNALFLTVVNLSISAVFLIAAVMIARLFLKKAPKWISCVLWALVALRLCCPVSVESNFSLVPSGETIPIGIERVEEPAIRSGIPALNAVVNPVLSQNLAPKAGYSVNPLQVWISVFSAVWILGMLLMASYAVFSYIRLRRNIGTVIQKDGNVWICDGVRSPFILGIFSPKICLPSSLPDGVHPYVLSHEEAHLKRHDHWWKPLGFLILTVYWFNPLCWLAYCLLCRDIEVACDEKVALGLTPQGRAEYSQALLDCSCPRKQIVACPVAFGEIGIKERVKNVLNYKKPALWIIIAALVVCAVLAVCFLTNRSTDEKNPTEEETTAGNETEEDTAKTEQVLPERSDLIGRYVGVKPGFGGDAVITLYEDGEFSYSPGFLSSFFMIGNWKYENGTVILTDVETKVSTTFPVAVSDGKISIRYQQNKVTEPKLFDCEDGAEFRKRKENESPSFNVDPSVYGDDLRVSDVPVKNIDFTARYLRTDGVVEQPFAPLIFRITSAAELKDYLNKNRNTYNFETPYDGAAENQITEKEAFSGYDDSFFEKNDLLVLVLWSESGSFRYSVKDVSLLPSTLDRIQYFIEPVITVHMPENYTDDEAVWHILIEVDKEYGTISEPKDICVIKE